MRKGGELMEKDRTYRVVALVALIVAVVGVSLGFAAFSRSLSIEPSGEVNPENTLKVEFSSTGAAVPTTESVTGTTAGSEAVQAGSATITNTGNSPKISGLTATFTKPGESVTYEFYAVNTGKFDAYLTGIKLGTTLETFKKCTAKSGSNPASDATDLDKVCGSIHVTVEVGEDVAKVSTKDADKVVDSEHKLTKAGTNWEKVVVKLEYTANETGDDYADGDVTVTFQPITLTYSTVKPA